MVLLSIKSTTKIKIQKEEINMGMFSQNRTMLGDDFEVIANESYQGAAGAYRAMTEGFQISYAVFG